ncbi:hypothetical protein LY90DRAFT_673957 [Neocallimastix californiae]|uniref:Uncharacterized protein n=1 Tax=Neocallimastix californiae TaxID=1754190 RepID=A0A1Y2B2Y7_9FUNG|nr:hypothetical protein LY90DRAFT_673957 [Neocallimastix californiae]|eukprot:ORY29189.1 hypothetical protein LY90DRAFT_673957 [Neocallimastix californiae]
MMPNPYETFMQDDAEHFLVAIDKANSREVNNSSPHSDNEFNTNKKNFFKDEPVNSKIYNAFINVPELLQWAVLLLGPNVPFTCTVRNFIDDLCNDVECMIIGDKGVDIHWSSMEDGVSTIPFLLTAITKQISHQAEVNNLFSESVDKPQLILCVIPNEGSEEYIEEIKRICKKIKIVVVFIKCSEIANSTPEFRSSLGEEMKDKLIQFLIDQSQEQDKRKFDDDYMKQPKSTNFNKYNNGNGNNNQNSDQEYKNGNVNFSELSSPKYHYPNANNNFDYVSMGNNKGNYISPLNMNNSLSRSFQYNSLGRTERDRYYYSNNFEDNTLSPGWNSSKPIYFSKGTNSPSQLNTSFNSRNNNFSVSPSPHSSTPRREREGTFSSLRNNNYSYFNSQYHDGSSPINMDKKGYFNNNNDTGYSISNNSELIFMPENESNSNNITGQNKHSRSNTICNGVISTQKETINSPRKYSASNYSKSFNNNNNNNYNNSNNTNNNNYTNFPSNKIGLRNKFVNNSNNNKRLSMNYSIGNHDKNNEYHYQYQYTNSYLEGLNLERNYKNNSNWEGRNYNNSYNNKLYTPMEYHSYSYNDNKSKNNKYYINKKYNQDSSSSESSPTKNTLDIKSNRYDRIYDNEEEIYNNKTHSHSDDEITNKIDNLKVSKSFDKNEVPKYRPPIPPYSDKIENDDIKLFTNRNYNKRNEEDLSRSLPTKNFFSDIRSNRKSNEINDWNKNYSNKSNYKYGKYSNSYKGKSNDNYEENDLDNKKETTMNYNSTNSSPVHLTVDIKNLKYRAPTPKNLKEGKYKSISPDSYFNSYSNDKNYCIDNDSTKDNPKKLELNNDNDIKNTGSKSDYSLKKEIKPLISTNESTKTLINNPKSIQSSSSFKTPSTEKYIPPNLRNKYGNGSNFNSNSNFNSFDKHTASPDLFVDMNDEDNHDISSSINNNSPIKVQSELTKEIQAQHNLARNNYKSPLSIPSFSNDNNTDNNNNKIIENKHNDYYDTSQQIKKIFI